MCHVSRVMCHVSCVMCHVSHVTCHMSKYYFLTFFYLKKIYGFSLYLKKLDKVVELVGGESVINGAYPVKFYYEFI